MAIVNIGNTCCVYTWYVLRDHMRFARRTKPSRPAHQAASQWVSVLCHKWLALLLILLLLMLFVSLFCNHFAVAFVIHWENPYIFIEQLYLQPNSSLFQSVLHIDVRALSTHATELIYTARTYVHMCVALYGIIKFGFFRFAPSVCVPATSTHRLYHIPTPPASCPPPLWQCAFFTTAFLLLLVFLFFSLRLLLF